MGLHQFYNMHVNFITDAVQGLIEIIFGYGLCLPFEKLQCVRLYLVKKSKITQNSDI